MTTTETDTGEVPREPEGDRRNEGEGTRPIRVGTRGSALALAQAKLVVDALERAGRPTEVVRIVTEGDRRAPDTAWGEGAFVGALEQALLEGRVDLAVHSAKDVPTDQDERLALAAFLTREDPRDALVVRAGDGVRSLADLPPGARVGTDSPRRTGFVRAHRPDLDVHPLHGNVDTRLRRLDEGQTDALVLAVAGLARLGRADRIADTIDPSVVPPAPGQGAIAVQVRAADDALREALAAIDDPPTRAGVEAERAFLVAAGGGCRAPIGALATVDGSRLSLIGGFARPDGSAAATLFVEGPAMRAKELAADLVRRLTDAVPGVRTIEPQAPPESVRRPFATTRVSRVLVTRQADQAAPIVDALGAHGFEPCLVPAIATRDVAPGGPLDDAARASGNSDWIVVTSPNGARAMLGAFERSGIRPAERRWAAVGSATAEVLRSSGVGTAWQPTRATGAALAEELPLQQGQRAILARANIAGREVPDRLRARGAEVLDVVAYSTVEAPPESRPALEAALANGLPSAIMFASGSAARGMLALAGQDLADACLAIPAICIGATTASAARDLGFRVAAIAERPAVEELVRLIADVVEREQATRSTIARHRTATRPAP